MYPPRISQSNRATTVKDLAELAMQHGLMCQKYVYFLQVILDPILNTSPSQVSLPLAKPSRLSYETTILDVNNRTISLYS